MHIKEQDKDPAIFIKYNNWQSEEKTPIDFAWMNLINSIALEWWKSYSCLLKIEKNEKKILWKCLPKRKGSKFI